MTMLLNELIKRIKENCEGSNHELTKDQLDDIQDSLLPFARRFDQFEDVCLAAAKANETEIDPSYRQNFESLFED